LFGRKDGEQLWRPYGIILHSYMLSYNIFFIEKSAKNKTKCQVFKTGEESSNSHL